MQNVIILAANLFATKIVNAKEGINRVVYDYTNKPPGTIEWEVTLYKKYLKSIT